MPFSSPYALWRLIVLYSSGYNCLHGTLLSRFASSIRFTDTFHGYVVNRTRIMEIHDKRMDRLCMHYSFIHALRRFLVRNTNVLGFGLVTGTDFIMVLSALVTIPTRSHNRWNTIDHGWIKFSAIVLDLFCMQYSFIHALRRFLVIPFTFSVSITNCWSNDHGGFVCPLVVFSSSIWFWDIGVIGCFGHSRKSFWDIWWLSIHLLWWEMTLPDLPFSLYKRRWV